MATRPNTVVTSTTPPSLEIRNKIVQVVRTDTVAFDGFVIPKGSVILGGFISGVTASDAETTAIIDIGTNPATADEVLDSFSVKTSGDGFFSFGAAAGTAIGTQLTADTLYKVAYSETGAASTVGGPWLVTVLYYTPRQGFTY